MCDRNASFCVGAGRSIRWAVSPAIFQKIVNEEKEKEKLCAETAEHDQENEHGKVGIVCEHGNSGGVKPAKMEREHGSAEKGKGPDLFRPPAYGAFQYKEGLCAQNPQQEERGVHERGTHAS